jgi:hypothetical protein
MIQMKTQVLNLKTLKTKVPMGYLIFFFFNLTKMLINLKINAKHMQNKN